MKDILVFIPCEEKDMERGSYDAILNGKKIDGCDINFERKITQAHIVIAGVKKTLGNSNFNVVIENGSKVEPYSIVELIDMSQHVENYARLYTIR